MMRLFIYLALAALLTTAHAAPAAEKLRISYSGPSISNALLWVTQKGKLFEKNGLDVEVLYLAGPLGQSALMAGETQLLRGFTRPKPYPSLAGFRAILNDLTKRMPAAKNADAKEFIDTRFIEELDKSGTIDGM